jgi:glycosyltransferase involved in cell wall biosynthesis
MKIAVWHNLPSGGGKRALFHHVRGLKERGHEIEVWCPTTADQTYLPLAGLVREHFVPLEWAHVTKKGLLGKIRGACFDTFAMIRAFDEHSRRCAVEINRGGFDLFYAASSTYMVVAPVGRYVTIPKVLYLQEPSRPLYEALPKLPWVAPELGAGNWKNPKLLAEFIGNFVHVHGLRYLVREELRNIQAYEAVFANSYFSRESILKAYGVNSSVCYLGIDLDDFSNQEQVKENFVIGIGSFNRAKNIEFVIRALGQVSEPRPRLIWVGNYVSPNSYLDELRELARGLHVDFVPKTLISDAEMIDLLNRSLMMLYAPRLEPFGLTPLEANACGVPVVAVAEGGIRETVLDGVNGLLVEPEEAAMARAVELLRGDRGYACRLGANGLKLVREKWSLEASIDRIEGKLKQVVTAARR